MADAEIRIKTVDETGAGFDSVATRFDDFDRQVQSLEKNLKPLQEVLKAGVGASAALAGLGAAGKNAGNLGAAFSDLQTSFLGIKGAAESAAPALGVVGKSFEGMMDFGTGATKVFGGLMAAFEVGKQMKVAFLALNTVMMEARAIQTATAAATAATATAQTAATASTGILSTATAAFNLVLSLNPIFLIGAAIVAATAAIAGLAAIIWHCTAAEEENTDAMKESLDMIRARNEEHESARSVMEAYGERLGLLSQKEALTASEQEEMADIVQELAIRYGDLGIEIDKTTGKVLNYAEAQRALKRAMLEEEKADAEAEVQALEAEGRRLSRAYRESKKTWLGGIRDEGDEEIRQKIIENRKALREAEKRRTTAASSLTSLDLEKEAEAANAKKEAEEEAAKIRADGLAVQKALQDEIIGETQTALEKELAGLASKLDARKKELEALKEQGKITEKQQKEELEALKELGDKREAQIRARHAAAEAEKSAQQDRAKQEEQKRQKAVLATYAVKITAEEARRAADEAEKAEDDRLAKMDPQKALEAVKEVMEKTQEAARLAKSEYDDLFAEASKDGVLTDDEKAALDAKAGDWQSAVRQRDRYSAKMKGLEDRLKAGKLEASQMAAAGPVESITRGSVEALRKEMALGTKNPMVEALEKAERKRDRQAKKQIELAEESVKIQRGKSKTAFKGV